MDRRFSWLVISGDREPEASIVKVVHGTDER